MLDGTVKLGEAGVPVLILPMPIAGTTAPMSLLSTIIQNNAEVLAGNAILQTAHPGRAVLYGAAAGILDMSTTLFCVGSAEGALQNAACGEMAKFYGLPGFVCVGGADAQTPGIQSTIERTSQMVVGFLGGADILCGVGLTGTAQYLYREELIIGEDIVGYCKRIADGVRTGEEHALTDLAIEVGPGGNFLAEESTVDYLYNGEHFMPKTFCRESSANWENSPKKDIMQYARSKAKEILDAPPKENFNAALTEKLGKILLSADAALAGDDE
jgi:trimethylamine--corrinoid protein Co-methyltransferase